MLIGARVLVAAALLSLAGCSARVPSGTESPSLPATSSAGPPASAPGKPSGTATMLCGSEIRDDVTTALALRKRPVTESTWIDRRYTCTYILPMGRLVLSVKESGSAAAGQAYYDVGRASTANAKDLTGMQGLGQPGYETSNGVVVFLKDGKTLRVDASGLPAGLGPHQLSPAELAYEVATDILGCWNEK